MRRLTQQVTGINIGKKKRKKQLDMEIIISLELTNKNWIKIQSYKICNSKKCENEWH